MKGQSVGSYLIFSDNPPLDVTSMMKKWLWAWLQVVWSQTTFGPAILLNPWCVLLMKPQLRLNPSLDILNLVQLWFSQCYRIIDIMILRIMYQSIVQICSFWIYRLYLPLLQSTTAISFETPEFRVLKSQTQLFFVLNSFETHYMLTSVLLDQWFCSNFRCLAFQPRLMFLWPSSRSTVEISFGSSNLWDLKSQTCFSQWLLPRSCDPLTHVLLI
jgi:hypothetical protein